MVRIHSIYWADPNAGTITPLARAGGNPLIIASGLGGVQRLAVDRDAVYYVAGGVLDVVNVGFRAAFDEDRRTTRPSCMCTARCASTIVRISPI